MQPFDSQQSVFQITDTGATLRDISAYITGIDGLPGRRELAEATILASTGRQWYPIVQSATITLELLWSDDASVGSDTVLGPLRTHDAAVAFDYGPEGKSGGDIKYSGNLWVDEFTNVSRVGDLIKSRCVLQVDNGITRGTY